MTPATYLSEPHISKERIMTDEPKNLEDAANQPYQPPEAAPSQPEPVESAWQSEPAPSQPDPVESAWQPEAYTPPTAEPPAGMTDTTPDEALFAPPSMDASSFEGAEPATPAEPAAPAEHAAIPPMQGEVVTPPVRPASSYTPPAQPGGGFTPPPVYTSAGTPVKKEGMKWWVIVLIVLLVLCCCCAVVGVLAYVFGDQILSQFQGYSSLLLSLAA